MYSYADRLRAVELYVRLGKRLNATIRQLGYPTKNALRGWYREYVLNRWRGCRSTHPARSVRRWSG